MTRRDKLIQRQFFDFYRAPYCFVFALAVEEGTGAELVCIEQNGEIVHAGCKGPGSTYKDVRGILKEEDFIKDFVQGMTYVIRSTTKEELHSVSEKVNHKPIPRDWIDRAMSHGESLWPAWGWKEDLERRMLSFAEELEALCHKHRVYLREQVPAQRPILYQMYGDEKGFKLTPLPSAKGQYVLERIL